jgi:putative oxidoreductase
MVALGLWPDLGALILFLFLVPTAFLIHPFWKESESRNRAMEQVQF